MGVPIHAQSSRLFVLLVFSLLFYTSGVWAQYPRIFYSDLTSGPNTGGEDNNGSIVALYGKGFGATQGTSTVTVGTGTVAAYKFWSDTKVAVAIGPAAATGSIVVHTDAGDSNEVPFTVRPGNIYCVSAAGDDSKPGRFPDQCWATLTHAKIRMVAGDITYIRDGVSQTNVDNYSAALWLGNAGGGAADNPKALVAYPGAVVTVGGIEGPDYGIRGAGQDDSGDFWVIAGLLIRGKIAAINLEGVNGWTIIGNELTCPNGSGAGGCFNGEMATDVEFMGNYVHDTGNNCGNCELYNAVNFSNDSSYVEVAWNTIVPKGACRALQFYAAAGSNQHDLYVHDNLIHDAVCDGISFATVNPADGPVEAYNNIVYHVGTGPDPSGVRAHYACFNLRGESTPGASVELYNNTMYDCGSRGNPDSGGLTIHVKTRLRNNILRQISSEPYLTPNDRDCSFITGTNNLWFGAGEPPPCAGLAAQINADPNFVNAPSDFHLRLGSPAIDSGTTILDLLTDFEGLSRPQGIQYDIGAYEFLSSDSMLRLLGATPTTVDFGNVAIGINSAQTVTLTNTGTSSVTLSSSSVTGADFRTSGLPAPLTLAPAESVAFSVNFAPMTSGTVTGSVSVTSNAANSPTTVSLAGTGIALPHSVDLAWNASPAVVGYNVYRGTTSGGPYTKLNSSLIVGTTYTDRTVLAGQTYFYVATSVSGDLVSDYSQEVQIVVPSP